jgi:hypothetical protein
MSERISGGKIEEKNNLRVGDYVMFEDGSEMVGMATNAVTGAVWQVEIFGSGHATSVVGTTTVS